MLQVLRGGIKHKVYLQSEADAMGLVYVPWWDVWAGGWMLSDDGYVLECLGVREYYDKTRSRKSLFDVWSRWVFCAMGKVNSNMKRMDVLKMVRNRKELDGVPWDIKFVRSRKGKDWMALAAGMLLEGNIDYIELCKPLGRVSRPKMLVRKYLYNTVIRSGIFAVMSLLLKTNNLDYNEVLRRYEEVYRKAVDDGKYADALKILDKYEKWTGLQNAINGEKIGKSGESKEIEERFARISADRKPRMLVSGDEVIDVNSSVVYDEDGRGLAAIRVGGDDE